MCGFFAYFSGFRDIEPGLIHTDRVFSTLARRGPDGNGFHEAPGLFMAHSRLSIIDLDIRSNQPFQGERWTLIYNGEIFNYQELRQILLAEGALFSTESDTEVLYRALEIWGADKTVGRLAGMYAFAAFDKLENRLWMARDPLGIKPLFVAYGDNYIACASWPATLLSGLNKHWRLDRAGLNSFFQLGAVHGGMTLVEQISSFPCGEIWSVDSELRARKRNFWTPACPMQSYDDDIFESLFEGIVQEHLSADVPKALLLSGGVDSTALGCFLPPGSAAFHLNSSETDYAKSAAQFFDFDFHIEHSEEIDDWETRLFEFSAETGGLFSSARQVLQMSQAMAGRGFKVGLSANGADELFLGYPRTPAPNLSEETLPLLPQYERPPVTTFAEQLAHIFSDDGNFQRHSASRGEVQLAHAGMVERFGHQLARAVDQVGDEAAHRLFELRTYVESDLNPALDHASMFHCMEMRVPFLDHRLVEYALKIPTNALIQPGLGRKGPLKRILRKRGVPENIWCRAKVGFSLPSSSLVNVRNKGLDNLALLLKEGYLNFVPRIGNLGRDFQRTLSAAVAFSGWKRAWIDTGIVQREL